MRPFHYINSHSNDTMSASDDDADFGLGDLMPVRLLSPYL